jgi:hypothetical protein
MKSAQHRLLWNHISMPSQRVTRCIDPVLFELHDRKRVNLAVSHTGAAPVERASERRNRYLTRARRNLKQLDVRCMLGSLRLNIRSLNEFVP